MKWPFADLPSRLEDFRKRSLRPLEVAVLDSGVDATHPDLAGRIAAVFNVEREDGEVRVEPGPTEANNDTFGHGTAVASIITQIAPNARIVDVRVLGGQNRGAGSVLVRGLAHAVERGCPIINMSLAATAQFAPRLRDLCETAYRQGQIVVASKRNMPLLDLGFPAEFTVSVSVDTMPLSSLFRLRYRGDEVIEFAAHGEEVEVAAAGGGHTSKTGTSFATPAVAGLCALLLGAYPDLRPFEIKTLLKAYAGDDA
ncbi:MAG: S8 family peptidase [Planctomycetota bacterium]|jgi:subtilisin family serine protease